MSQKEQYEKLVETLEKWKKIENASVASTSKMLEKTDHPVLRLVLETIQRDSQNHHNLQQMIIDSMTVKPMELRPEDVSEIWDSIEEHIELEKKTQELAKDAMDQIRENRSLATQFYMLNYLLVDEEKHQFMLDSLEKLKKDMFPYA
ncbi:hypothetical protein GF324_12145 [bacterium]|nr:hypothetical protein [bacterium]